MLLLPFLLLAASSALTTTASARRFPLSCAYVSTGELKNAAACAAPTRDGLLISPHVVRVLRYDGGLATIGVAGRGWFFRRRNGRIVRMLTLDNGPDPFSEGLARGSIGGRFVYVDRRLRVRLRTPYTFGMPFEHGRAQVCTGCVELRLDGGEHTATTGGRWSVIDRRGSVVSSTRKPSRPQQ